MKKPSLAVLLAASFAFIIVQLDVTIVNVALPEIGRELHAGVSQLQWVVDAYTLGFAVFLLSAGVLGDRFGARRIFLSGFTLFTLASVAAALAPDALALNISRAVQGVGAALLVPSSLSILNATYSYDRAMLAKAIAWWTAAGGVSIALGPVVGGLLMSVLGWRSIFWVNVPIAIIGFWVTMRVVPALRPKDPGRTFDLPGQILAIIALTAFIGVVIEANELGMQNSLIQGALLVAVAAAVLFLWVEQRSKAPMLPLKMFKLPGFSGAVLFGVFVNFAYYGIIFVLSFYLQKVRGFSVLEAGLIFLPLTGTFLISNIISGKVQARVGSRTPMIVGGLIGATGYALLGFFGISGTASFWAMLPGLALIPGGMGLGVPAMTTAILSSVDKSQSGTASAVLNTARQVGGATGVAIYGALIAGSDSSTAMHGIQIALVVSTLLLLGGAYLAWQYIAPHRAHAPVSPVTSGIE